MNIASFPDGSRPLNIPFMSIKNVKIDLFSAAALLAFSAFLLIPLVA